MTLDEWIAGDNVIERSLIAEKIKLINRAIDSCVITIMQMSFAKTAQKKTGYKDLVHKIISSEEKINWQEISGAEGDTNWSGLVDSVLPTDNFFVSDPSTMKYLHDIFTSCENDKNVLSALENMSHLDFDCTQKDSTPEGYQRRFDLVVAYLRVLYRLYAEILPQRNHGGVNIQRLHKIDLSMSKLLFEAGQISAAAVDETIRYDGICDMKKGEADSKNEYQELTKIFYNELGDVAKKKNITSVSKLIEKKYEKEFGKKKTRTARQIRDDLKDLGIFPKET